MIYECFKKQSSSYYLILFDVNIMFIKHSEIKIQFNFISKINSNHAFKQFTLFEAFQNTFSVLLTLIF
jgi:hypothetical protein